MAHLEVFIDPDREASPSGAPTVRGRVRDDDGSDVAFVGWVGLLALLQRALDTDDALGDEDDEVAGAAAGSG
jgi:hypothetical protein